MVRLVAFGAFVVLGLLAFLAVWPPAGAPVSWRRLTRGLRHRVRRRYYRNVLLDQAPPQETTGAGYEWDDGTQQGSR